MPTFSRAMKQPRPKALSPGVVPWARFLLLPEVVGGILLVEEDSGCLLWDS